MEVVIGSENRLKARAVAQAFKRIYPEMDFEFHGVAAESGVSDHPTTGEESLEGAKSRAKNARDLKKGADFYVGIEGGLSRVGERAYEHSFIAIENQAGEIATATSAGLELRGKLLKAILNGQELNLAFAEQYGAKDIGKKNGMYGMATNDLVTRETATTEAVIFAMSQFLHPEYFN